MLTDPLSTAGRPPPSAWWVPQRWPDPGQRDRRTMAISPGRAAW